MKEQPISTYSLKAGRENKFEGKRLSPDEEILLAGFALADELTRADWLEMAQRRIAAGLKNKASVIHIEAWKR
jgi:gluconate kinase